MMNTNETRVQDELKALCADARALTESGKYNECLSLLCKAMAEHPDAAEPHNLYGLLQERIGNHVSAMKHFRAALDLDPSYAPPRHNLMTFGTFYTGGRVAYESADCTARF